MSNLTKLAILFSAIVSCHCFLDVATVYETVARWQAEAIDTYWSELADFYSWQSLEWPADLEPWVTAQTYVVALGCEGVKQLLGAAIGVWLTPILAAYAERKRNDH